MKRFLLFIILLSSIFTLNSFAQTYGWMDISANIPGDSSNYCLCDIYFISDDEGWICNAWLPEIYHTTDGGETFEVQTTQLATTAIHMLNENEGYAGGYSGFVYKTTGGGTNWNFHGTIGATVTDISFPPSGGTGYASGLNGAISSITSSGVTPMNSGVPDHLGSISFPIHSEEGWVCGGSIIAHYFNGAWIQDQIRPSGGYNAICMVDNLNGWAVGDDGIIIHTTDGINWFEQTNPDTSTFRTLQRVFFLNNQEGWAVGTASIIHTTNGGIEWTVEAEGLTYNSLAGVHFTSPTNGYVGGQHKTLLKYGKLTSVENEEELPTAFSLSQNYPNPFNPTTKISFTIAEAGFTSLKIYDILGNAVATLVSEEKTAGEYYVEFSATGGGKGLTSGIYFYQLRAENFIQTKKMILMK